MEPTLKWVVGQCVSLASNGDGADIGVDALECGRRQSRSHCRSGSRHQRSCGAGIVETEQRERERAQVAKKLEPKWLRVCWFVPIPPFTRRMSRARRLEVCNMSTAPDVAVPSCVPSLPFMRQTSHARQSQGSAVHAPKSHARQSRGSAVRCAKSHARQGVREKLAASSVSQPSSGSEMKRGHRSIPASLHIFSSVFGLYVYIYIYIKYLFYIYCFHSY